MLLPLPNRRQSQALASSVFLSLKSPLHDAVCLLHHLLLAPGAGLLSSRGSMAMVQCLCCRPQTHKLQLGQCLLRHCCARTWTGASSLSSCRAVAVLSLPALTCHTLPASS